MTFNMSEMDAPMELYQLSDYLCRYYGKKVIILLDEYDTPMQEAYVHGYWEKLVSFSESVLSGSNRHGKSETGRRIYGFEAVVYCLYL